MFLDLTSDLAPITLPLNLIQYRELTEHHAYAPYAVIVVILLVVLFRYPKQAPKRKLPCRKDKAEEPWINVTTSCLHLIGGGFLVDPLFGGSARGKTKLGLHSQQSESVCRRFTYVSFQIISSSAARYLVTADSIQ